MPIFRVGQLLPAYDETKRLPIRVLNPMQPTNALTRPEVYSRIDGELEYAHRKWNTSTTPSGGKHSPLEWLVYIEHYVAEAKRVASTESDLTGHPKVMAAIRKIGGLAVTAMEEHGVDPRPPQPYPDALRVWIQSDAKQDGAVCGS